MGKSGSRSNRRDKPRPSRPRPASSSKSTEGKVWLKPLVWVGGVATAVLTGVLVGTLSPLAQYILPPPSSHTSVTPPSSSAPAKPGGGPLTVRSEDPLNPDHTYVWSFAHPLVLSTSQLSSINSKFSHDTTGNFLRGYLYSLGGYLQSPVETQLVVENNRSHPIRIIDANVIKSCAAPLTGTVFYAQSQGADDSIGLGFDLDSDQTDAKAQERGEISPSSPSYFTGHTVSIQPGAQQVFNMAAVTQFHSCTFQYVFTILDGPAKTYQTIGYGSKSFRISALAPKYSVDYEGGRTSPLPDGEFVRVNPINV